MGIPSRLLTRIPLDSLLSRLIEPATERCERVPAAAADLGSGDPLPLSQDAQNGRSGLRETCNPDAPKAPTQIGRNRHHSTTESANVHIQGITRCLLQPPEPPAAQGGLEGLSRGGTLIFPDKLLPEERVAAEGLLERCAPQAQALLDELAGRLQQNTVHTSPLAYLRGMVRRADAGDFVPELGLRIAAARRLRADQEAQRLQRDADARRLAMAQSAPDYPERVAARQVQVRKFLDDLHAASKSGGAA